MSYTTFFDGAISVDPPLNEAERDFLSRFSGSRRMRRARGPYYVGGAGLGATAAEDDVEDADQPAYGQPGLWCRWRPTADGSGLAWAGEDLFADAEAWIAYVIDHFLRPGAVASRSSDPQFLGFTFDHVCNGVLLATGDDDLDRWLLVVRDNAVGIADLPSPESLTPQRFARGGAGDLWPEVARDAIGRFLPEGD